MTNCTDIAYEPQCQAKAAAGLCNASLADSNLIRFYCQKSCGLCTSSSSLSCSNLINKCSNNAICLTTGYFNIPSITCNCPVSYAGAYCQRSV